jgi:hypothetical protein
MNPIPARGARIIFPDTADSDPTDVQVFWRRTEVPCRWLPRPDG